jgi:hypothetical protein
VRPALSVVVANAARSGEAVVPALEGLAREARDADVEVLWVDRAGLRPEAPSRRFVRVDAAPEDGRGELYARGLAAARAPVVAFTDSETVLLPGWRRALEEAVAAGAAVVGGPVLPGARTARAWAGFLVDYAAHAVPPYRSASGDVSGNNVAYRAAVLAEVLDGPVWKSLVNARLAARGVRPVVAEGMRVEARRRYSWRALTWDRVGHGRQYALWRAAGWSRRQRIAWGLACPLVAGVLAMRLARTVARHPTLRRPPVRSAPLVALALGCWSVGEAAGYLRGGTPRKGLL